MRRENDSANIEREIDAALKMLSGTTPPAGMTSRIHRNLETAAAGRARRGWLFWMPATCAAMAAVLFMIFFQMHSMREKQRPAIQTAKMVVASDRAMTQQTQIPTDGFRERRLPTVREHPISHRQRSEYRRAANLLSYPLTRQEKLLVRFVQTAKPADLRDLNLEGQVKLEVVQDAAFVAYLKLGSPSYNETIENTPRMRFQ